ncbi:Spc98 family-domain-containing protein [Aspergillus taichungensis]|uniref:Spindle pole body component n=1 Tax=Aspergillus taichungensis TaxID=482145 RepID=A0A2J5I7B3_9EURO|nr:Spc98 family-domain-containing protein [Aspergillus taichungensis]
MAVAASVGTLTEELITAVAKPDRINDPRFKTLKRRAQATLKSNAYPRTDQFAVAKQLEGLQEKFQVLDKDDLADALRLRLVELEEHRSSWFPEILSLLLQLADRPAQYSNVDRLESVAPKPEAKNLSWSDIDPAGTAYCDDDIWEAVDYGAGSSEDDLTSLSSDSDEPRTRPQSSVAPEEDYVISDDVFSSGEDEDLVASIKSAQFWREEKHADRHQQDEISSRVITELQMVRETISMLQGLPTSLFWRLDDSIEVDRRYTLAHLSNGVLVALLRELCSIGGQIDILRRFSQTLQSIAYMQTFHRRIDTILGDFDAYLSRIESRYLSRNLEVTVSLLQLCQDVRHESKLLLLLAEVVSQFQSGPNEPIRCLDLLYDRVCSLQATGDDAEFMSLAELFFACFETYARPIRLWMEAGHLEDSAEKSFFIHKSHSDSDLRTLWQDWYTLDGASGLVNAPKFIRPLVHKIFITGKSMIFLHHLNVYDSDVRTPRKTSLALEDVFPDNQSARYLPFYMLFESAFGKIVDQNHSLTSALLRQELDQRCGLWVSLRALECIYLGRDMSVFSPIDNKIFDLIDRGKGAWRDRYLLTDVAQSALSALPFIEPSRLIVRTNDAHTPHGNQVHGSRSVNMLDMIAFDYVLPWPIANIITRSAILRYQRIAIFLMQIRRAKHTIVQQYARHAADRTVQRNAHSLSYALHHNMLWLLNTLYSHLTDFVISTSTLTLHKSLSAAEDVTAMIDAHSAYLSSLEAQLLLSTNLAPLLQATTSLLDLCISFANLQSIRHNSSSKPAPQERSHNTEDEDSTDESDFDEEEFDYDDETENNRRIALHDALYDQRLRDTKDQFHRLVGFLAAGLKGIGRVDGQLSWEMLAEKLDWRRETGSIVV